MKKAFIDQILMGFLLFAGIIILIATVSDDESTRTKFYSLKKLTDTAALAAAKHYNENQDQNAAETVSRDILLNTKLGAEVEPTMVYTWDFVSNPNNVIATIPSYQEDLFWYKFLSLDDLTFTNISSKANIITSIITTSSDFSPLAINDCNRTDIVDNAQMTFEFHSYQEFDVTDEKGFYGVTEECSIPHGNSFFAHYKNIFNNPSFDADNIFQTDIEVDLDTDTLCLPQTDFNNQNTVNPKQLHQKLQTFPVGSKLQIALLDCGSTAASIVPTSFVEVEIMATPTCTQGHWTSTPPWENRVWNEEKNSCNGGNYDYKLLTLDLKFNIPEDNVILEY